VLKKKDRQYSQESFLAKVKFIISLQSLYSFQTEVWIAVILIFLISINNQFDIEMSVSSFLRKLLGYR